MDYLKGLNEQQKEAVMSDSKYIRVVAGAGSGKTRVLTTRLVHLVKDLDYNPSKLCAITFTNKAANEMKERLEVMLMGYRNPHISTIHSLCVRIIRIEHKAMDLPRNFIIMDSSDQRQVLKEAYDKFGYKKRDLAYGEVLNYISNNKMAHVSFEEAIKMTYGNDDQKRKAKIYQFYVNRLEELSALDFDDLLLKVYYVLKNNEDVRAHWQQRFDVVCVDEFQDIDEVQYGIIRYLVGERNQLYVVGDPDQTIYTWRGANVNFIADFDKRYPTATTIVLNKNYRSTQNILSHANELISQNKNRVHKDLEAHDTSDVPVEYNEYMDGEEEAREIAKQVIRLKSKGSDYSDIAILYRSNYLSRILEREFSRQQIPYMIYGGQSFYDRMETRDMVAYLRMITSGDDLALRRSVAKPRRGIGEKTIAKFANRAEENGSTIYQMMLFDYENGSAKKNISKYVELIEGFKEDAKVLRLDRLMEKVFETSGLRNFYEEKNEDERVDSVRELYNDAYAFMKEEPNADLVDYLQMISIYTDKEEIQGKSFVSMMTVHAAKGLEFENVFIMGVSEGTFPNERSMSERKDGLEEERRLMYVAITRAKKRLFVSNNSGYSFVTQSRNRPSRFVGEMSLESDTSLESNFEFTQPATKVKQVRKNKRALQAADIVIHDKFGEGIILQLNESTMSVAFNFPHGQKTISLQYDGLKRKES